MPCPECGNETVSFRVPASLSVHTEADAAEICTVCLAVQPIEGDAPEKSPPSFDEVASYFPDGEAGAAMALLLGVLDAIALNRATIVAYADAVERAGGDPLLTLDRLADDPDLEPYFDVGRRRTQLLQVLE